MNMDEVMKRVKQLNDRHLADEHEKANRALEDLMYQILGITIEADEGEYWWENYRFHLSPDKRILKVQFGIRIYRIDSIEDLARFVRNL